MSHPSQTPPGNRPPNARVFRPFTGGGTAGQGAPTSPTPPATPQRRAGQPFRPFVGAHGATIAPTEPQRQPTPTIVATAVEPVVESIPASAPAPTYHAPEPAPIAHEAWERYVAPEPEPYIAPEPQAYVAPAEPYITPPRAYVVPEPEAFIAPEPDRSVLEEPIAEPAPTVRNSEITVEVPQIGDAEFELEAEPIASAAPTKAKPPITVEVPAIPSEEAMAAIRDVAHEGDLWETAYSSASIEQPSKDVVIDEVEAAFSESAPSSNDRTRLDDALVAAITLEAIARRLRNGEVDIRPAPGASMSAEESALATVLAALLANR
jgi:hypothetical protein